MKIAYINILLILIYMPSFALVDDRNNKVDSLIQAVITQHRADITETDNAIFLVDLTS
jgi:hypothetical protein